MSIPVVQGRRGAAAGDGTMPFEFGRFRSERDSHASPVQIKVSLAGSQMRIELS